jgi:hypothetical protein
VFWSRRDGQADPNLPIVHADPSTLRFLQGYFGKKALEEYEPAPVIDAAQAAWMHLRSFGGQAWQATVASAERLGAQLVEQIRAVEGMYAAHRLGEVRKMAEERARREEERAARRKEEKRRVREQSRRERAAAEAAAALDPLVIALRQLFSELPWLRGRRWPTAMLERVDLGRIRSGLADVVGERVLIDERHPAVKAARARGGDREALACLASAAFTAVNRVRADVGDAEEIRFAIDLADWVGRD